MKKKFIVFLVVLSLFASSTVAYAAGGTSIKAVLSNLKIYFGNSKLNGSVITYKNVKYIPAKVLSDNLGFKISSSSSRLTITETESKDSLRSQINSLENDNSDLKNQIKELNEKLRFYSGGEEDYTGQSEEDYFNSLNYANSIGTAVWPLKNNEFIKTARNTTSDTWYKIEVNEGQGITAVLHPQIDKGYMYINMYDKDGKDLYGTYSASNGEYAWISQTAASDTTYYIKIKGEQGIYYVGFYDNYYNNQRSMNDERDFFGSLNTAKVLSIDTVTRDDANRYDFYRVDLKEGQTLSVSITPQIDRGYLYLNLYNKDGSDLSGTFSATNGKTATITKKASADCTYFIKVRGEEGKYNLYYSIN